MDGVVCDICKYPGKYHGGYPGLSQQWKIFKPTLMKQYCSLLAALFWSIWPHEIWLYNQNHINPMSVIWSLKLFSQKIDIDSITDFDSASRSSNGLKNGNHTFHSSLFLFNNFLLILLPLIKCVNTSWCPHCHNLFLHVFSFKVLHEWMP